MNSAAAVLMIMEMLMQVSIMASRWLEMKKRADAEGRDINDDELEDLKARRRLAVKKWHDA